MAIPSRVVSAGLSTSLRVGLQVGLALTFVASCGGSSKGSEKPTEDTLAEEHGEAGEGGSDAVHGTSDETPEQAFERQKADAVGKMCTHFIDCGIASAPDANRQELEDSRDMLEGECLKEQGKAPYSPRQIGVVRDCLSEHASDCAAFNTCIGQLVE